MQSEAEHTEFLALLKAAREQVAYLKELGVEGTEKQSTETAVKKVLAGDKPGNDIGLVIWRLEFPAPQNPEIFGDF